MVIGLNQLKRKEYLFGSQDHLKVALPSIPAPDIRKNPIKEFPLSLKRKRLQKQTNKEWDIFQQLFLKQLIILYSLDNLGYNKVRMCLTITSTILSLRLLMVARLHPWLEV